MDYYRVRIVTRARIWYYGAPSEVSSNSSLSDPCWIVDSFVHSF